MMLLSLLVRGCYCWCCRCSYDFVDVIDVAAVVLFVAFVVVVVAACCCCCNIDGFVLFIVIAISPVSSSVFLSSTMPSILCFRVRIVQVVAVVVAVAVPVGVAIIVTAVLI